VRRRLTPLANFSSLGSDVQRARTSWSPWWNLVVNRLAPAVLLAPRVRTVLLRSAGIQCRSLNVAPGLWVLSDRLTIGVGAFVGWRCVIHNEASVEIGDRAAIGPEVVLLTTSHEIGRSTRRAGDVVTAPIRIGRGAWIGARTLVLPGVTIGDGCVIAAGSVVIGDCDGDALYAGVPAVRKRSLSEV